MIIRSLYSTHRFCIIALMLGIPIHGMKNESVRFDTLFLIVLPQGVVNEYKEINEEWKKSKETQKIPLEKYADILTEMAHDRTQEDQRAVRLFRVLEGSRLGRLNKPLYPLENKMCGILLSFPKPQNIGKAVPFFVKALPASVVVGAKSIQKYLGSNRPKQMTIQPQQKPLIIRDFSYLIEPESSSGS